MRTNASGGRPARIIAAALLCLVTFATLRLMLGAASPTAPARAVTSIEGPVGDQLRLWYANGLAAGNTGDSYDNRDRGHSELDLRLFPQLQKITYTDEDRKANRDWAIQRIVLPPVVFGNSSTA